MSKRNKPSNQEILHHKQWWSKTFGWVDLSEANNGYVQAVYEYWFFQERPKVMDKINRVTAQLNTKYKKQVEDKNKRRIAVVQMNDAIINKEYIKRMLSKK